MKNLLWIAIFALAGLAQSAFAAPVVSCDDVNSMGEALTELGIALDDENAEIGEGSDADNGLRSIVDGLQAIADAEQDADLQRAASNMDNAWQTMDRGGFTDALADAVDKLAVIATTECE